MELESTLHEPPEERRRPAPHAAPALPSIPGYQIEGAIGAGSTGTVYRAIQLAVDRPVALKLLHLEHSGNSRIVRRLVREARTLARLKHPGIVGAIDMGQGEGRWWFAMELVEGQSLSERLRAEGPLSEREALRLFVPLAEAVEHLWEHGVVHRDIKPANILLEGSATGGSRLGRPRLADLGLAFVELDPSITGEGSLLGTPHYLSPEQARDPAQVGVQSDLWALGATIFHAVCGRPPFVGRGVAEVLSAVLHAPIPDPAALAPGLSDGFVLVLRKCLVRSLEGRYRTPRELLGDLELLRERRAPKVRRASLDPLAVPPGRAWLRPRAVLTVGLSLLAGGVFSAVWFGDSSLPASEPVEAVGNQRYEPLDALLVRARAQPGELAACWADLEALRSAVPSGTGSHWWELREALELELRNALSKWRLQVQQRFEVALGAAQLAQAEALLAEDPSLGVRAATGFELTQLPGGRAGEIEAWRREQRTRLEAALGRARELASAAAQRRFEVLIRPEAESLWDEGRWNSALLLLQFEPEELLDGAGLESGRLPEALRREAAQVTITEAKRLFNDRFKLWLEAQEALLASAASALEELQLGQSLETALPALSAELEARWDAAQAALGVLPGELPSQGSELVQNARQSARRDLVQGFGGRLLELVEPAVELRCAYLTPAALLARTPASALVSVESLDRLLQAREAEFSALSGADEGLASVLNTARLRLLGERGALASARAELQATERLLEAAAAGLQREVGQRGDWVVPFGAGGVPMSGVLAAGNDPRQDGFQLRVDNGQSYPLAFERLDPEDLLRLARRGAQAREESSLIELAGGLLLLREGRRVQAAEVLRQARGGPAGLVELLSERLQAPTTRPAPSAAAVLARLGLAGSPEALELQDPEGARALLELLLGRFSGDAQVGLERSALEARLERLTAGG